MFPTKVKTKHTDTSKDKVKTSPSFSLPVCVSVGVVTYLVALQVVHDGSDEVGEGEEDADDEEADEVQVHEDVVLIDRLVLHLQCQYQY